MRRERESSGGHRDHLVSTRRRQAASGVLLGFVVLEKGSDISCFSQLSGGLPFPCPEWALGLELADSWFGGKPLFLTFCSVLLASI